MESTTEGPQPTAAANDQVKTCLSNTNLVFKRLGHLPPTLSFNPYQIASLTGNSAGTLCGLPRKDRGCAVQAAYLTY
jgi:hypothetical protein